MKNKRFVLDTNILISALLVKNSTPFKVIKIVETIGVTLYSSETLQEINQVLKRKKFDKYLTSEEKQEFIVKLVKKSELVKIQEVIDVCRDSKDNKFLEVAVSGQADFIITGDKYLLVLNPFRNIGIITVNEFLIKFTNS